MKNLLPFICLVLITYSTQAQTPSIHDLDFLIGTWQVREDIADKNWWEKTTRIGHYTLDSTFIELEAESISSTGKERTYRWFIHYNSRLEQFEMISMFSNWHKVQKDILEWDAENRKLTIRHGDTDPNEYHERFGEMTFAEDFSEYEWKGENKYGDRENPGIWRYVEKGKRIK